MDEVLVKIIDVMTSDAIIKISNWQRKMKLKGRNRRMFEESWFATTLHQMVQYWVGDSRTRWKRSERFMKKPKYDSLLKTLMTGTNFILFMAWQRYGPLRLVCSYRVMCYISSDCSFTTWFRLICNQTNVFRETSTLSSKLKTFKHSACPKTNCFSWMSYCMEIAM